MHKPPFAWLKKISPELLELDSTPLFGKAPPFDWEKFSSLISSRFGVQPLTFRSLEQSWLESDALKQGLGPNLLVIPLIISPLQGEVFWIMSRKDVSKLTSWLLNGKTKGKAFSSELLQEGFYRYLLLEALDTLQEIEPMNAFTLHLNEEGEMPETRAFCIDIEINFDSSACWGRLAIPPEFRKSWIRHFEAAPHEFVPAELAQQTSLNLGIRTGSVRISQSEWEEIEEGDFLLLDKESYDPRKETGSATLTLGQTPLFTVRIKKNKIEVLDYAFTQEETMEQKAPGNPPKHSHREKPAESFSADESEVVSIKETPLLVCVELARLRMSLEKLMHLSPGNFLELPIQPDQSVSLTVNGQVVGRAELVHLGEALGLRILEIGK
jgi:flagellar motor switch protein FliN/FliY